ncbi:D-arabinono-1,4-lactone oxidase [Brachybacterium sp. GPGPB12]|uniref:D-arabinono-1,4-lactone oxidase n=1 Tax=Brachybacterium sp. GPGPB12 TaxID=3023517 RepID=UPI0031346502
MALPRPTPGQRLRALHLEAAARRGRGALPEIEERLAPFAPRPHWGKVFTLDPEVVQSQYPDLERFRAPRDRLDPERVFRNEYVDRSLGA